MLADFKCDTCGNITEELVRSTFKYNCSECGSDHGTKLLSVPAVIQANGANGNFFKGGSMTQMDTLNGRPKRKKFMSNQFR